MFFLRWAEKEKGKENWNQKGLSFLFRFIWDLSGIDIVVAVYFFEDGSREHLENDPRKWRLEQEVRNPGGVERLWSHPCQQLFLLVWFWDFSFGYWRWLPYPFLRFPFMTSLSDFGWHFVHPLCLLKCIWRKISENVHFRLDFFHLCCLGCKVIETLG